MRSRLALITAITLLTVTFSPLSASAANPESESVSWYAGLIRATGLGDLIYGVPVSADGFTGGAEPGAPDEEGGADGDADGTSDESDDSGNQGENADTSVPNRGSNEGVTTNADPPNANTSLNTGGKVSRRTLLSIIIGIIFGQDRPFESEKRG